MNDIYQRKFKGLDYFKLASDYLKKHWILWTTLVVTYVTAMALTCSILFNNIMVTTNKMMLENAAMMANIKQPNLSESQIFILIEFILMVVQKVVIAALIVLLVLAFLHSLVSMIIFVSQDLFVRQSKIDVMKFLKYCLSRFLPTVMTDCVLGFYLTVLFILIAAVMMASLFLISDIWMGYFILAGLLILLVLAIDWIYVYPATYKYKVRTNKAIHYSTHIVRKNLITTLIWLAVSGGLYLLIGYLLANNIIAAKAEAYPTLITVTLVILVSYNFVTKLFNNFIFLNCDYLAREKEEAEELYGDLISIKMAPIRDIKNNPPKRNRRPGNSTLKNEKLRKKINY